MDPTSELLSELRTELRGTTQLDEIRSLLAWDQQTMLATRGHQRRAEQLALLSAIHHERFASKKVGDLLSELSQRSELDEMQQTGIQLLLKDWRRAACVPAELVERLARLQGQGHMAWMEARAARDFRVFAPVLQQLVDATIERAHALEPGAPVYDVLVDDFEPGMSTERLTDLFRRLRAGLLPLLDAISGATPMPRLEGTFPRDQQMSWCLELASAMGFATDSGRVDLATHPFTTRLGPTDIRITTYLNERNPMHALGATLHETGHALYEQGLPSHLEGTGVEQFASMGLHESQSRFWENTIGRSAPFFRWLAPRFAQHFGAVAPDANTWYRAANRVERGTNRVLADEVTYNLHVIVRFELERALFAGEIQVPDLRDAWAEAYRRDLTAPQDDVEGVLQDIHWSGAAFGYFPTYTLGNLYSAALGRKMQQELPVWELVERGEFAPILGWLRERVHQHGRRWPSEELVRRVTGESDVVEDLVSYLWARHGALHGVTRA
jgi:carboxypeptidase Taq